MLSCLTLALAALPIGQSPEVAFVQGANRLGMAILQKQVASASGNVMVSPLSIATALALVEAAASGGTRMEIDTLLGWGSSGEAVSRAVPHVTRLLTTAGGERARVTIVNSIWTNQRVEISRNFQAIAQERFGARVASLNFADSKGAASTINTWVSDQTNGKIKRALSGVDANTIAVIVNAVTFKATWSRPFSVERTTPQSFHGLTGGGKEVPMMTNSGSTAYGKSGAAEMLVLNYSAGGYAMAFVLPSEGTPFRQFAANFSAASFEQIRRAVTVQAGTYTIPKWKADCDLKLNNVLYDLGLRTAFDVATADFTAMTRSPMFISEVVHRTYIEVDEKGTEAGAVTAVGGTSGGGPPPTPFKFVADRPFLYFIVHQPTGMICFAGTVTNP